MPRPWSPQVVASGTSRTNSEPDTFHLSCLPSWRVSFPFTIMKSVGEREGDRAGEGVDWQVGTR